MMQPVDQISPVTRPAPPREEAGLCLLCGSGRRGVVFRNCPDRLYWQPGVFDVVRCLECGLVRTDPRPQRDAIPRYYPPSYLAFEESVPLTAHGFFGGLKSAIQTPYRLRYGSGVEALPPNADGGTVLDIGCGSGTLLASMAKSGWKLWGIESDAQTAAEAARRLAVPEDRIVASAAEDADFPEATFDLITLVHVVEHLHDPYLVLTKAHRWLKPGGTLHVAAPNFDSVERRVFGRYWLGLDVPRHLTHFSPTTLRRLLERAGFEVERVIPSFEAGLLGGSVQLAGDALRGVRRQFHHPRTLRRALFPVTSLLSALGVTGAMEAEARKR